MYLYLGQETIIPQEEIIGVFDLDTTTVSKVSRDFLRFAQQAGEVINVSMELPKSFILRGDNKKRQVYISQISTTTLLKRMDYLSGL